MILLDTLYTLNSRCASDNSLWDKFQIKRTMRVVIKVTTNSLLPYLFRITKQKKDCIADQTFPMIVSLTSYPKRIGRVWMTIESILRQTMKPKQIVLWLSRDQFPNKERDLPESLLEQMHRGLSIRFLDGDIRSYKKFYYAFTTFKDYKVVTIDDDLLFPSFFLESLYTCSLKHPDDIIASFGFRYIWDESMQYISVIPNDIKPGDSGLDLFYGSGGGTLFNSAALIDQMDSIEKIIELCPTADDIYLNALTRISGLGVTFHLNNPLLSIVNFNDNKLVSHNGNIGDNTSTNAKQMKALIEYLTVKFNKNPFRI